jgi:hypothetical protein
MKDWWKEPLVAFVAIGTVLALVWIVLSGVLATDEGRAIAIDEGEIELLASTFERQWQRPPTEQELRGLVDARVREEVLYRQALAMGLDRNDVVVRRRMVQKVELLTQDLATMGDPPEEELRAWFTQRAEDYRVPPLVSFRHVYFNEDRRGVAAEADAEALLASIRTGDVSDREALESGDRFMLAAEYRLRRPEEIAREFGTRFADAVATLEPGWHGPIRSGYGLHLVLVTEREEGRIPEYERVRERVLTDYQRERRERANALLYEGLRNEYEVTIDEEALEARTLEARRGAGP